MPSPLRAEDGRAVVGVVLVEGDAPARMGQQPGQRVLAFLDRHMPQFFAIDYVPRITSASFRWPYRAAGPCTVAGAGPGKTKTRVPTFTLPYRSSISELVRRMQPEDTKEPMVEGWLVP